MIVAQHLVPARPRGLVRGDQRGRIDLEMARWIGVDIGGGLSKASFVTFLDWKQQQSVNISWQAYTNVSFPDLKFSNEMERNVISNNFILCPERMDACQGATHLKMRLADAIWTTINMASRL